MTTTNKNIATGEVKEQLVALFTELCPDSVAKLVDIYVCPRIYRGVEATTIRYELVNGDSVTYNLTTNNWAMLLQKITEQDWNWLELPNRNVNTLEFTQSTGNPAQGNIVHHPLCLNLNANPMDLGFEEFIKDEDGAKLPIISEAHFNKLDEAFRRMSSTIAGNLKQLSANFNLLKTDPNLKQDHELFFAFSTDLDNLVVESCLTPVPARIVDSVTINETPTDMENFKHLSKMGIHTVETITKIGKDITTAIDVYMDVVRANPGMERYARDVLKVAFIMLAQNTHQVYRYRMEDDMVYFEEIINKVLTEVGELEGVPGLDLNSWRVYNYIDAEAPVPYDEELLPALVDMLDNHTNGFVECAYAHMLHLGDPLLRPYVEIEAVAEENIKDHAIGSIRMSEK